ncbi:hypothetical protein BDW74DRAFT_175538 [Aspergillus multicolor]|uniref:uncharacterized protein n=1 Tax=Aspergillus multicolor TaxID=41759 RepID=UPI003CCCAA8D
MSPVSFEEQQTKQAFIKGYFTDFSEKYKKDGRYDRSRRDTMQKYYTNESILIWMRMILRGEAEVMAILKSADLLYATFNIEEIDVIPRPGEYTLVSTTGMFYHFYGHLRMEALAPVSFSFCLKENVDEAGKAKPKSDSELKHFIHSQAVTYRYDKLNLSRAARSPSSVQGTFWIQVYPIQIPNKLHPDWNLGIPTIALRRVFALPS